MKLTNLHEARASAPKESLLDGVLRNLGIEYWELADTVARYEADQMEDTHDFVYDVLLNGLSGYNKNKTHIEDRLDDVFGHAEGTDEEKFQDVVRYVKSMQ